MTEFRIADTFTASLNRLTAQEQKAAKTTAFDLQIDATAPGLSFHKLDRAQDKNFWSVRVNADIRIIVHRTSASLMLAYVGHHDDAYRWAERRKIERHPTTGAMQLVEVRERMEEVTTFAPTKAAALPAKPRLFDNLRKFELMKFGVPEEWVDDVRRADEDTLLDIITHLPQEAQEALLKLAVGEQPEPIVALAVGIDPFLHPDAQRRFRVLTNAAELQRALDFPWEKWAVFLHPDQTALVERDFAGPVRVSGSAGTGKTVVALHRAVHLARRNSDARVLLTTFSNPLAALLQEKLFYLVGGEAGLAARITVRSLPKFAHDLYAERHGIPQMASDNTIRTLLMAAGAQSKFSPQFLFNEWTDVVDAWQLKSWDDYANVARLGRKTRLGGKQREDLWQIFSEVQAGLTAQKAMTWAGVFDRLTDDLGRGLPPPFDFTVVDEAQDIGIPEARFLGAFGQGRMNALFLTGDLGQRIFQQPFSWKSLGLDVGGRSFTLRINYRTSHQIRMYSDRLLPGVISDVDGNTENRGGTVSVFDGPVPEIQLFPGAAAEQTAVGTWLAARMHEGVKPEEIGVFVRAEEQIGRAKTAIGSANGITVTTMHGAKGLEFRAVVVMACDDEILPFQSRVEGVADQSDLEDVYHTERHLLYVACTRARDRLLITGISPGSEFLADLRL